MAIEQKVDRCTLDSRTESNFQGIDGRIILPLNSVPFELEEIIPAWMMALPERFHADAFYFENGAPYLRPNTTGGGAFVSCMTATLDAARLSLTLGR